MTRREFLRAGLLSGLGLLGLAGSGGAYSRLVEPHWLELVEVQLPIAALPQALEGFTIAQLSDLHLSGHMGPANTAQAVAWINEIGPDLVVLTGDFVYHGAQYTAPCAQALAPLHARYGVYATLGNHDVWDGAEIVAGQLSANGIRVLRNEVEPLVIDGQRLWLIGLEDTGFTGLSTWGMSAAVAAPGLIPVLESASIRDNQARFFEQWAPASAALAHCVADLPDGEPRLLLAHNPDFAEMLTPGQVDAMLSGHTHGGQIRLPLLGAPVLPSCFGRKYTAGLVRVNGTAVYVNRGLGVNRPAMRFNCRPEVTILRLCRAPSPL